MTGFYPIGKHTVACANAAMMNDTVKKLWNSFCLTDGELEIVPCGEFVFRVGETALPTLTAGKEFALTVDEQGIALVGRDYGSLMRGFCALLLKFEYKRLDVVIRHTREESHYLLENRMVHLCVFPDNDLYFIKKFIRLAALCQFTHIVIEFWGMLQYDCLKELAWPHAFTKAQARELIKECRELGLEPIPMSNQLGHATASRRCYGKHVVLDQNPRLQYLFTPDGWAWDITSEEVAQLLKTIREELYEVFGPGSYMHIGCDEAYYYTQDDQLRAQLPGYLNRLTHEVEQEGRRPMLWMDMLLEKGVYPNCYTTGEPDEVEKLRNATAASSIFVDWQYDYQETPIPTLLSLKDCGRDVMGAPWENHLPHIRTVAENGLFGLMLTTWHILQRALPPIVLGCAHNFGASMFAWSASSAVWEEAATMLRRVSFEGNSYTDCGWSKTQVEV